MQNPTSHRIVLRWSFASLAAALAVASIVASPIARRDKIIDEHISGSIGASIQQIQLTPGNTENSLVTQAGIALPQTTEGYQSTLRAESAPVIAENPFIAVGVRWHVDQPEGTAVTLQIRLADGDIWTDWRDVRISEDAEVRDDPDALVSDLIFVPKADKVQLAANLQTANPDKTPRLLDVRLDLINTQAGPNSTQALQSITADAATIGQPTIISRTAWGADESWMTWSPDQGGVQQLILHHTAGSDGGNDSAAVIRGIYYYHAVTLGWGDIGYNFLVDSQGNIYEGRVGGLGTVGGHTSGYNTGSVGIAMLGTYEQITATPAAENAVANLAGYLTAKYDLDPQQVKVFIDRSASTLASHRDFNATLCPGTAEYARMGIIRASATSAQSGYLNGDYQGSVTRISGNILPPQTAGNATITLRNTGQQTWVNSGANPVVISTDPVHASTLHTSGWPSISETAVMREASVAPGQNATFVVPLGAANISETSDTFAAARRGLGAIAGTQFTLTRSVRTAYAGQVINPPDPIAVEGGTRVDIEVRIKNTGALPWTKSGTNFAALNLTQPKGRSSVFHDSSWPQTYRPTLLDSETVLPDSEGVFRFTLKVPPKPGDYYEPMQPVIEGITFMPGAEFVLHLLVSNPYQSELYERPIQLYGAPGQLIPVSVTLANRSTITWKASGSDVVALEALASGQTASIFHANTWLEPYKPAQLPHDVAPGDVVNLTFMIAAPPQLGEYQEFYRLVSGDQAPVDGSRFTLRVAVRPAWQAQNIEEPGAIQLSPDQTIRTQIKIKNTGSSTWRNSNLGKVTVKTANPTGHASAFATATWNDSSTPTILEPPVVGPDQVATLSVELRAAAIDGTETENFALFDDQNVVIPGSNFKLTRVTVGNTVYSGAAGPTVRVGITSSSGSLTVSGNGEYVVKDTAGKIFGNVPGSRTSVAWSGSGYTISGAINATSTKAVRFEPVGSTILELPDYEDRPGWNPSLNDNTFRGVFELRRSSADGKLYAINELSLEQYLSGLAEASNGDNPTYLQTLITAARTYAEYHRGNGGKHPEHGYDLDNKNDQVYKGYNFELRSPSIAAAVQATTGLMVTYQGAVVVTPYFSQSDGHTRGFHEVWGGAVKPWLVSVQVPENIGKTLSGHGVGMDASAARLRAIAGQSRDAILKSFYSGVAIEKRY